MHTNVHMCSHTHIHTGKAQMKIALDKVFLKKNIMFWQIISVWLENSIWNHVFEANYRLFHLHKIHSVFHIYILSFPRSFSNPYSRSVQRKFYKHHWYDSATHSIILDKLILPLLVNPSRRFYPQNSKCYITYLVKLNWTVLYQIPSIY